MDQSSSLVLIFHLTVLKTSLLGTSRALVPSLTSKCIFCSFFNQDLAIAAYLVSLWEEEECKPKSFIDLGCGNGLLVYILTQEGYPGGVGLVILTYFPPLMYVTFNPLLIHEI